MKPIRAEYLLDGDVIAHGTVAECEGDGDDVRVTFRDGSTKTIPRTELIEIVGKA